MDLDLHIPNIPRATADPTTATAAARIRAHWQRTYAPLHPQGVARCEL